MYLVYCNSFAWIGYSMEYFTVDDSLDELVVGKDFQFIKGDNPEAPEALIYFILFLIV